MRHCAVTGCNDRATHPVSFLGIAGYEYYKVCEYHRRAKKYEVDGRKKRRSK